MVGVLLGSIPNTTTTKLYIIKFAISLQKGSLFTDKKTGTEKLCSCPKQDQSQQLAKPKVKQICVPYVCSPAELEPQKHPMKYCHHYSYPDPFADE